MSKRTIAAAAATAVVLCLAAGTRAEDAATRQEDSAIEERSEDVVQGDTATVEDQTFVCRAAEGSAAEVELADLALTKSDNDSVKEFAEQMKRDRSAAQGVLAQAASREGIDVPKTLDDQHRTIKAELEKLDGPEFDRRYMNYMLQEHKKDIALFAAKAPSGDGDVSAYAQRMVSVLDAHLRKARDVSAQLEGGSPEPDPRQGMLENRPLEAPGNDATLR